MQSSTYKLVFASLLCSLAIVCFPQSLSVQWNAPSHTLDAEFKVRKKLYCSKCIYDEKLMPYYPIYIYSKKISVFNLSNYQVAELSEEETKLLPIGFDKTRFDFQIEHYIENNKPVSRIMLCPIRYNAATGSFEKLVRFEYSYDEQPQETAQTKTTERKLRTTSTLSSVLASGDWYKLNISADGIYKIDYAFLKSMGINPDAIDPRNIRIYGNGGGMLPQENSASRPDDLLENNIFVFGESDGIFNSGDYILFYAKGPDTWTFNPSEGIFNHTKNIYSNTSSYFLTTSLGPGARVPSVNPVSGATQIITTFDERLFHENDAVSIIRSGREWYGERFDAVLSHSFSFSLPGLVPNSPIAITSAVLGPGNTNTSGTFTIRCNGNTIDTHTPAAPGVGLYDPKGVNSRKIAYFNTSLFGNNPSININVSYNKNGIVSSIGYLNYLEVNAKRQLQLYGNYTAMRSVESTNTPISEYRIENTSSSLQIWNVTNPVQALNQLYTLSGTTAIFSANSSTLQEYVVFSGSNFPPPVFVSKVPNQNLHGIQAPWLPDMVIVTVPEFKSEAERLKNFKKTNENLDVLVVTTEQVYNEFSSGSQDVTAIRDFMKMLYDRKSGNDSLRYLLLFGDCSYDYKNRISGNTNFVPVYQSRESLHPLRSYSSDDYFAFLDNSEGAWPENGAGNHMMDIGVGRLVVRSQAEASQMVDKIIHYSSHPATLGKWRNRITFVSDDGDANLHIEDANNLAIKVDTTYKKMNVNKIFLDAYPQTSTPGGEKAPIVKEKIDQEIARGTLIMNYSGHGGQLGWAQESILDQNQIASWNNINQLPFMITATCDFGRYDDPSKTSGAELALVKSDGGVIGLITSTRVVFQFSNFALNEQIYNYIFTPVSGTMPRLGDIIKNTKNNSLIDVNNRNYALLGDPSLTLAYPKHNVVITKINNQPVDAIPDTMKALSKITIQGEIQNSFGMHIPDFDGVVYLTLFDKPVFLTTFGTEGTIPYSFKLQNNFFFDGSASIREGKFSISFIVPKDISYEYDFGKISAYAKHSRTFNDAAGYYSNIVVGGTNPDAPLDNTPPTIKLFMNDETFVNGGLTASNALFIAKLSDEHGINISGAGIGHELAGYLDNSDTPIIMNEFYTSNLDDYQNGYVRYPLKNLSPGYHSMRFKAWDTYNNSNEAYIEFMVASDEKLAIKNILNYPNPFSSRTIFHFDHNRAGEDMNVMIHIYTISGKLVKTLETTVYNSSSHFEGLEWDGRDEYGDKIGRGVYVYKLSVRSPRDGSIAQKLEKLVLLY
ncbi:MAG: type IX secretion system sortase PorU [Cytophagaceae bacterium]|nr:type IX secretion system sortase PorU [Cytophagaceae bacterium]MDW8456146.1 type IX secretion system sortase PorU [Cytophagaceae bacterium]